jgi:NAD(P)-dependent dehydrogenase (short-subunit alcohol dehydrogenase family)
VFYCYCFAELLFDNLLNSTLKNDRWYSYRCSKAALNMLIKNISIEVRRKNSYPIIVGLHPGTVNSKLSSQFTSNVSKDKVFSADYVVAKMIWVLLNLTKEDTGKLFAWDGKEIGF